MTDRYLRRPVPAFVFVGVVVPSALLVVATATIAAWLPRLPDPVAMHWGESGVDGFGPRWTLFLTPLIAAGLVLLCTVVVLTSSRMQARRGRATWSPTARFLGAVNLGTAGFLGGMSVLTAGVQLDLAGAADSPDILPWTIAGLGALVLLAVLGWFLQPSTAVEPSDQTTPAPVRVFSGERAAWLGSVSVSRTGSIVLGALSTVLLAIAVLLLVRAPEDGAWGSAFAVLAISLAMLVVMGSMLAFRVRVNQAGLRVRSLVGWPSISIPLDEIAKVEVVECDPFGEFGGWGWRLATDGRRGVVLRAGPALQITRTKGTVFVVTVDGAEQAGAVLEGLRVAGASG